MLKNLMLATVFAASFGANAAVNIKLELSAPNAETQKYEIDIELSDRATLTLGDTDLHISIAPAQDSEQDDQKIVVVIDTDVRNEKNEIINQGQATCETIWGSSVKFILTADGAPEGAEITLLVTVTKN